MVRLAHVTVLIAVAILLAVPFLAINYSVSVDNLLIAVGFFVVSLGVGFSDEIVGFVRVFMSPLRTLGGRHGDGNQWESSSPFKGRVVLAWIVLGVFSVSEGFSNIGGSYV